MKKIILALNIENYVMCDFFTQCFLPLNVIMSMILRVLTLNVIKGKMSRTSMLRGFNCGSGCHIIVPLPLIIVYFCLIEKYMPSVSLVFFSLVGVYSYVFWYRYIDVDRFFPIFERGFRNRLPKWRLYVFSRLVLNWTIMFLYLHLSDR